MGIQTSSINSGPLAGFKNAIINGNFDWWQRGTSLTLTPSSSGLQLLADRWGVTSDTTGGTKSLSRQSFTNGQTDVPNNPRYFNRFEVTGASTGGTFTVFLQRIEGVQTFAGQQVTVSFYAKAASTFVMPAIQLEQRFGTGGSPSAMVYTQFVTNATIGTSWIKYTYTTTLPSISGKTLGTGNNDSLTLSWICPVNSTFTFDIAQVQLELGPVATNFELRPYQTELDLCQRYYEASERRLWVNATYATGAYTNSGSNILSWKVVKRAAPTATLTFNLNIDNCNGTTAIADTDAGGIIYSLGITNTNFPYCRAVCTYTANADTLQ